MMKSTDIMDMRESLRSISRSVESIKKMDSVSRLYELGALSKDDYIGFCQDILELKGVKIG